MITLQSRRNWEGNNKMIITTRKLNTFTDDDFSKYLKSCQIYIIQNAKSCTLTKDDFKVINRHRKPAPCMFNALKILKEEVTWRPRNTIRNQMETRRNRITPRLSSPFIFRLSACSLCCHFNINVTKARKNWNQLLESNVGLRENGKAQKLRN